MNTEPTGDFAHNPEPLKEHLSDIRNLMRKGHHDVGFVVDPDVDRLALVCEDGSMFGEEYTLVAVADYVLQHTPGNTVSNLSSTRALRDVTEKYGCTYTPAAVGEVNVVTKMKETGAVIGGEGNGGVIYPAAHYGRDALVGIALLLTYMAKTKMKATELRDSFPKYCIAKNRIDLDPKTDIYAILQKVKDLYKDQKSRISMASKSTSPTSGFICANQTLNRSFAYILKHPPWTKPMLSASRSWTLCIA